MAVATRPAQPGDPAVLEAAGAARRPPPSRSARRPVLRYGTRPVVLGLVCLGLFLYVHYANLDSIDKNALAGPVVLGDLARHLLLTGVSTGIVIVIAVPLGILLSRRVGRFLSGAVLGLSNLSQASPPFSLLFIFAIIFGIGVPEAIWGLVAYSALPILRNTMVGLSEVPPDVIESARGTGMSRFQVLTRIELPLAVPVTMAGIRTALVINVGTATLATFIGAGGLGDLINNGIRLQRTPILVVGSVLTAVVALGVEWLGTLAEAGLKPRGL
ncbi:MAG: ABC transporter permease [Acidimicrobiales bacterium]